MINHQILSYSTDPGSQNIYERWIIVALKDLQLVGTMTTYCNHQEDVMD